MEVLEAIETRRSAREFKPDPVDKGLIEKIVNAGRLAPTARNIQPWEFVVITDAKTRKQLAAMIDHGKFITDSPVCIIVLSRDTKYYLEDGTAATTSMLIAARGLGLATCWVAGDKKEYRGAVVQRIGAPADMKLISLIALGYSDEPPSPPKRALEEVLHWEEY
jgi:nitroreductase